jgi:tetratricopeptide (TPR) repeat protein
VAELWSGRFSTGFKHRALHGNDCHNRIGWESENHTMRRTKLKLLIIIAVIAGLGFDDAWAQHDLVITFPRRSQLTPVQRLNREGVEAVKRNHFEKAEALFYKAYLYDPGDPFTLNNLGYISELQGQLDRAQKFYELASEQASNTSAAVDITNSKRLQGKPISYALESLQDAPLRTNRMNVDAMRLLSDGRSFEAAALLEKALTLDVENPFTLNNLGVADEAIGNYESALKYYNAVAASQSLEPVVVTWNHSWRGKPVSGMAAESARRLQERMLKMAPNEVTAIRFTLRGVSTANQNDWLAARQDFLHAYSLDPDSGFSLNNRGYVAERDGDLETAHFFYDRALKSGDSKARVGLATALSAEGKNLSVVAKDSNKKVDTELNKLSQERRRQTGPIELTPRDDTPSGSSGAPSTEVPPAVPPPSVPQSRQLF